jgi:hypothetical protein
LKVPRVIHFALLAISALSEHLVPYVGCTFNPPGRLPVRPGRDPKDHIRHLPSGCAAPRCWQKLIGGVVKRRFFEQLPTP